MLTLPCLLVGCARFESKPLDPAQTAVELESRSLADPGLRRFLETNLGRDLPAWPLKSWDFPALTLAALYYHPSLDVARAQWATARAGVKTAGGRPNPTVGVSPQYAFNPDKGVSPWVAAINFDLPIETAGKRGDRIARAQRLSESARLNLAAQAWQVRRYLRAALLDHAAAQRRAALLQELLQTQQAILTLLEGRLAAGAIAAHELTPARVAILKTQTDLTEARRQAVENRARVAEALGLPFRALDGVDLAFDVPPTSEAARDLASAEVRREALHRRADILAGLAEYAASQSALQLEIARQYPDIHLSTGYEYDQGENKWGFLGLGTELPVLNRNQGPIAEAEAKRTESAARFLALQAKVIAEIDRALAGRAAVQEQLRQIDLLLDTDRKQVRSVEAMQQAGAADQLELRTAQLEVRLAELARLDALVKAQQALGQLEDAVQVPYPALRSVEQNPRAPVGPQSKSVSERGVHAASQSNSTGRNPEASPSSSGQVKRRERRAPGAAVPGGSEESRAPAQQEPK